MKEEPRNRTVDTGACLTAIREILDLGESAVLSLTGYSMTPFLFHERDRICISPVERPPRRGDMAFFQRENGQYVMHRIFRAVRRETGEEQYYFIGDAQRQVEGPIRREQIFGLITSVCRKGKWIGPGNFWWEFFEHVWLRMIPFRGLVRRAYGVFRK